jgi:hypothetical protein
MPLDMAPMTNKIYYYFNWSFNGPVPLLLDVCLLLRSVQFNFRFNFRPLSSIYKLSFYPKNNDFNDFCQ